MKFIIRILSILAFLYLVIWGSIIGTLFGMIGLFMQYPFWGPVYIFAPVIPFMLWGNHIIKFVLLWTKNLME